MDLRPAYKRTELGVIPEDWEVAKLGSVAQLYQPVTISASMMSRHGYPVYGANGLVGYFHEANHNTWQTIITCRGSTCGTVNRTVDQCWITGNAMVANVDSNSAIDKDFFYYLMLSQDLEDCITGTGQPQIVRGPLANFLLAIPTNRQEQKAIAAALSDVDATIASLKSLITKKRDVRNGVMQRLLAGESRLAGFSTPWGKKRLSDLGVFLKGAGVKRDDALSGHLPCVRYGEIYTTHHNVIRQFSSYISRSVAEGAKRIQFGDLLFAGSGETKAEIGKCVALAQDVEAYAGGDIIILRPKSGNPVFLGWLMNTPQVVRQKANFGQGDAVVHISASALASIEVSLPDLDEQHAIARVITDMDAEITALEARLEKTRALKQGMMQALLTGRVRLPVQGEALDVLEVAHA